MLQSNAYHAAYPLIPIVLQSDGAYLTHSILVTIGQVTPMSRTGQVKPFLLPACQPYLSVTEVNVL